MDGYCVIVSFCVRFQYTHLHAHTRTYSFWMVLLLNTPIRQYAQTPSTMALSVAQQSHCVYAYNMYYMIEIINYIFELTFNT